MTRDARRRLAVRLEDGVDATTPAQQQAFVEGLGPETRETIQGIIEAAMTSAQKSALALVVGFVLLTLLASSALPAARAVSAGDEPGENEKRDDRRAWRRSVRSR